MKKFLISVLLLILSAGIVYGSAITIKKTADVSCWQEDETFTYTIAVGCTQTTTANVWDTVPSCFYPINVLCSDCSQLYWDLYDVTCTANITTPQNTTITVIGYFSECTGNSFDNTASAKDNNTIEKNIYTAMKTLIRCSTPTITKTNTPDWTATVTKTVFYYPSNTPVMTRTVTRTATQTVSASPNFTHTVTKTRTPTRTPVVYPSNTPAYTKTITPTVTKTNSQTPNYTKTVTKTPTYTTTMYATASKTRTITPTVTPTVTGTITPAYTATVTPTVTITSTPLPTNTPSGYSNVCDIGGNYLGQVHITRCANDMPIPVDISFGKTCFTTSQFFTLGTENYFAITPPAGMRFMITDMYIQVTAQTGTLTITGGGSTGILATLQAGVWPVLPPVKNVKLTLSTNEALRVMLNLPANTWAEYIICYELLH